MTITKTLNMNEEQAVALKQQISDFLDRSKAGNVRAERTAKGSRIWVAAITSNDGSVNTQHYFQTFDQFKHSPFYDALARTRRDARLAVYNDARAQKRYVEQLREIERGLARMMEDVRREADRADEANNAYLGGDGVQFTWTAANQGESIASQVIQLLPNLRVERLGRLGADWLTATNDRITTDERLTAAEATK